MNEITFINGLKAQLVYNQNGNFYTARLYDKNNVFLSSVICKEDQLSLAGEAMMQGYFAGQRNALTKLSQQVIDALKLE